MKLSKPQEKLLREIQGENGAWCVCFGDEYRTAKALQRKGLIEISEEWGLFKTHNFEARSIASQVCQSDTDPTFIYELGPGGTNRWWCKIQTSGTEAITEHQAIEIATRIVEALNQ